MITKKQITTWMAHEPHLEVLFMGYKELSIISADKENCCVDPCRVRAMALQRLRGWTAAEGGFVELSTQISPRDDYMSVRGS